jgi:hypothetical protein
VLAALSFLVAPGAADRCAALPTSQPAAGKEVQRVASRGPVTFRVTVDRDEVSAGDAVKMSVSVESEKGVAVAWPQVGETLGDFGVKEVGDEPATSDDLMDRTGKVYALEAYLPGQSEIPAIKVAFTDAREKADGSQEPYKDELETAPIPITVLPNLADVKGPVSLPWPWSYTLIAWAAGLLAAVSAVGILARWWFRRRAAQSTGPARPVPAHEWALAELDMLAAESLVERGKVREFYYRINGIVRGYIERRWGLMAGEQTSEEFIRALHRSLFLDDPHKEVLRRFVDACDPVKYARQQPGGDEVAWVERTARDFVLETAERPAEAKPGREAVAA